MGHQEGLSINLAGNSVHRISPVFFTLNHLKSSKDDSSSEAHLQSSKTISGSYLDPELYIFGKISCDPVILTDNNNYDKKCLLWFRRSRLSEKNSLMVSVQGPVPLADSSLGLTAPSTDRYH